MATSKRLTRDVLRHSERLLDAQEYPPGGRLPPERELAERFGVSRPTVREAIIALEALGRVEVKTGSGVYVLETQRRSNGINATASAYELTEARALIEGAAAALAATMISDAELAELEAVLEEMGHESSSGELVSELADEKFHQIISRATRNTVLISVIDNLWYVRDNEPTVHAAYQSICEDDPRARVDEHQEILDALKTRQPAAAREAMQAHFSRILEKLIAANEKAQVEAIRRQSLENRQRFSLNHLSANP